MRHELKFTLRLSEHVQSVSLKHFEFRHPYLQQTVDYNDQETYRAYIRDLIVDRPSYSELTLDQKYLHDLGAVISPILSAYRTKNRIPRLRPRTGQIIASGRLEECCQQLAMDAFNFKERLSLFGDSAAAIISKSIELADFKVEVGRIIRNYRNANNRLLKYRNFVVHGPKGRIDEFSDLRSWELSGIFLHSDLWLDYNNAFEATRSEWTQVAKTLINSMEAAAAELQILNEGKIEIFSFRFLRSPRKLAQ
jgi:hypothetical protein